jgi:hypothetical protein
MSAIPFARTPRHIAICADCSLKSGEGSREEKSEALSEGSNDVCESTLVPVARCAHISVDTGG